MEFIHELTLRVALLCHGILPTRRNQLGQATSEYGVVILIAIALGLAVLALFKGPLSPALQVLLEKVLSTATGMVKA